MQDRLGRLHIFQRRFRKIQERKMGLGEDGAKGLSEKEKLVGV